ncbi:hypothetical protein ACIP4V_21980 [Streptomyces albidoflavus]|uniref:hypothetical protein n=1 Tax=Streptomyces albidoflavus TaxID=1886 RepID=UPI000B09ED5B
MRTPRAPAEGRPVAAFASEAELLIPDEPTSGHDPLTEEVCSACSSAGPARLPRRDLAT